MVTSGVELFRRVKVMEQDLFSFILIHHFSNQVCEAAREQKNVTKKPDCTMQQNAAI
jgi:hypothetical protein